MAQIQDASGNPVLANVSAGPSAFAALNDEALVILFGQAVSAVQVAALAGTITISFEGSVDGTNYQAVTGIRPADGTSGTSTTANGIWMFGVGGYKRFRARVSAIAGGTASVTVIAGQGSVEAPFGGSVSVLGTVPISAVSLPLPTGAATSALQTQPGVDIGDVTVNNVAGTNPVPVQGNAAHDAAVAGNPVLSGAEGRTTNPVSVTDGDVVRVRADKSGRTIVTHSAAREQVTQNNITLTTTTETTLLAAGGAGVFNDVTAIIVSNTSGTAVRVDFRDATAGTVRFSLMIAANGGGGIFVPPVPVKQTTANNNWTAQLSGAVTDVRIFAQVVANL
jgi:hypothetical protein